MAPLATQRTQAQRLIRFGYSMLAATLFASGGVAIYYSTIPDVGPTGARIEAPADNATLTATDDKSGTCNDGFQTDVRGVTNEADGTLATLTANGLRVGTVATSGHAFVFTDVQLASKEDVTLVVQVGNARAVSMAKVRCANAVACRLLGPTWTPEHPSVNARKRGTDLDAGTDGGDAATWVAVGGGDSYSSDGAPYQISVEGRTSIAAGGSIEVFVDGVSSGRAARGHSGDEFKIDGVPLVTDGTHTVHLKCVDADGSIGFTTKATFVVDTKPPQLAPINVAREYVFGSAMLVGGNKIRVCASTTSSDAVDLPAGSRLARLNFCAGVNTSSPVCAAMSTHGADEGYDGGTLPEGGAICDGAPGCTCSDAGVPAMAIGADASYIAATGCTSYYLPGGGIASDCPTRCSGCPTGTTPSPWGGADNFKCSLPDGSAIWTGSCGCIGSQITTLPDGNVIGLSPTWDAGCYTCPNDGGSACLPTFAIGLDAGCRQCQYTATDGATSVAPWVCPWCTDGTKTRDGACVDVQCPGPAPFALRLSLYDGARNVTTQIIDSVQCAVAGPSIEIVDPVGGSTLEIVEDIAKRVLASSTTAAPRRDTDPNTPGAQYAVVACTDAAVGTAAQLFGGLTGTALTLLGSTTVFNRTADGGTFPPCPTGKERLLRFAVTIPESGEDGLGRLSTPTQLRVDMAGTDGGTSTSPVVDLWVDTTVPVFTFEGNVCGSTFDAAPRNVRVHTNTLPLTVEVTNADGTSRSTITDFAPSEYY